MSEDDFFKSITDSNPKPFSLPKRTWIGLTDEERIELLPVGDWEIESTLEFSQAIEAKLKEKNT
jgi:hypothetical protein